MNFKKIMGDCRAVQEIWGPSAETCSVPFFHVGAVTLAPLPSSKWLLSKVNYLTYPMCKKPTCDASQKGSKRHNWVTFFWLVKNYIYFSYSKYGKVMKGSEIGKVGEDEKCSIRKCNQCVTHMWPICGSSDTYIRTIYNPSRDSSETYM